MPTGQRDDANARLIKASLNLPQDIEISVYHGNNQKLVHAGFGQKRDTAGKLTDDIAKSITHFTNIKPDPSAKPEKGNPSLRVVAKVDGKKVDVFRVERDGTISINRGHEQQSEKLSKQPEKSTEASARELTNILSAERPAIETPISQESLTRDESDFQTRNLAQASNLTSRVYEALPPDQQEQARWTLNSVQASIEGAISSYVANKKEELNLLTLEKARDTLKNIKDFQMPTGGEVLTKGANVAGTVIDYVKRDTDATQTVAKVIKNAAQKVEDISGRASDNLTKARGFIDKAVANQQSTALLKAAIRSSHKMLEAKGNRNLQLKNNGTYRYTKSNGRAVIRDLPGMGEGEIIATVDKNGKIANIASTVKLEPAQYSEAIRSLKEATPENTKTHERAELSYNDAANDIANKARDALSQFTDTSVKFEGASFSFQRTSDNQIIVTSNSSRQPVLVQSSDGRVISNKLSQDDIQKFQEITTAKEEMIEKLKEKELEHAR